MTVMKVTEVAGVALSTNQTGSVPSTNIADRADKSVGPALLTIVTTIGATPTVTIDIQVSADGVDWWNVPYADIATPGTVAVAALVVTTATTLRKIIQSQIPYRYLRLNYSANTNVTITATLFAFGNA